jgi:hypothetical protein
MRRQRGVTMIGWIFLLIPVALVVYAGIRVGPEYYGYYKLKSAMRGTAVHLKGNEALSPQTIQNSLDTRFNTDYVDVLKGRDIEVTKNEEGKWQMRAEYEKVVPMFGNLSLLLSFDETVPIT